MDYKLNKKFLKSCFKSFLSVMSFDSQIVFNFLISSSVKEIEINLLFLKLGFLCLVVSPSTSIIFFQAYRLDFLEYKFFSNFF